MLPEINKYHDEKGRIFIGIIWILLILLVPLARVERAAHGLGKLTLNKAISHHF